MKDFMNDKWTSLELKNHVMKNGLGNTIEFTVSHFLIEDEKLAALWENAEDAMQAIVNYLNTVNR
jgi:hypothetical protein